MNGISEECIIKLSSIKWNLMEQSWASESTISIREKWICINELAREKENFQFYLKFTYFPVMRRWSPFNDMLAWGCYSNEGLWAIIISNFHHQNRFSLSTGHLRTPFIRRFFIIHSQTNIGCITQMKRVLHVHRRLLDASLMAKKKHKSANTTHKLIKHTDAWLAVTPN